MGKAQVLALFATVQLAPGVEVFTLRGKLKFSLKMSSSIVVHSDH